MSKHNEVKSKPTDGLKHNEKVSVSYSTPSLGAMLLFLGASILALACYLLFVNSGQYLTTVLFILSTSILSLGVLSNINQTSKVLPFNLGTLVIWSILVLYQFGTLLLLIGAILFWPSLKLAALGILYFRAGCILFIVGSLLAIISFVKVQPIIATLSSIFFIVGPLAFIVGGYQFLLGMLPSATALYLVGAALVFIGALLGLIKEITTPAE